MNRCGAILTMVFALTLTGCATNALRVQGAERVGDSAEKFVQGATSVLDEAKRKRMLANSTFIASDPSCDPLPAVNTYYPTGRGRVKGASLPLCSEEDAPLLRYEHAGEPYTLEELGYEIRSVDLRPVSDEALKPTVLLIGAIGDYGEALDKISERPNADISKELGRITEKAEGARLLANTLLEANLPDFAQVLANKQAQAATALLQFVSDRLVEARKVRDINKLVVQEADTVEAVIPELKEQLRTWGRITQREAIIARDNFKRAYSGEKARLDFNERLAFVDRVSESRADVEASKARLNAVLKGLDDFNAAQSDLRRLLKGDLNADEKKERAKILRQRMLTAFNLMARAVVAFGGL